MSEELGSFATAGSGKSEVEVAFDLVSKLKGQGVWGERNMKSILDMYAECLDAVKGLRPYEGQKRIVVPTQVISAQTTAAPARQAPAQPQAATPAHTAQPVPAPQQPVQPVASQPQTVQAQQQSLQQAYKQA